MQALSKSLPVSMPVCFYPQETGSWHYECDFVYRGINAKKPNDFLDLFCSVACYEEYRSRTSGRFLREVFILATSFCVAKNMTWLHLWWLFLEFLFLTSFFMFQELFQIERGICSNCQLDCHRLVQHLKPLTIENREKYIEREAPQLAKNKKLWVGILCSVFTLI